MKTPLKKFWYSECPACNQGRLFVMHNATTNALYLHCDECEMGFPEPEQADVGAGGRLTLTDDFEAEPATMEEIRAASWDRFAFKEA